MSDLLFFSTQFEPFNNIFRKIQAFIYDATTLEYAVGRDEGCKLKTVGKRYAETGYGIAFPKKSRWVKKFNKVLLKMQDDGMYIIRYYQNKRDYHHNFVNEQVYQFRK